MKSSGPVFTRKNPFEPASKVGKTHYHPSSSQPLTKKKKKTALSPVRLNRQSTPNGPTLEPKGKQSSKTHEDLDATTDGQPDYAELWPSSPASSVTSSDMEIPRRPTASGKPTVSFELGGQEDSVLAKYIERFRHGRPQSREERQGMTFADGEEQLPFWWMSPSPVPPSSTPTKTADEDVIQALKDADTSDTFSPAVQRQPLSPCRRSLSGEFEEDAEILHLQERASRLLLRGESTVSDGSAPVSSEGLGCSDFSSPVTVDEPVQRPLIPSLIQSTTVRADSDPTRASAATKFAIHSLVTPTRPEEDILFQWRLRRKMEQAKQWPQSVRHSSLHGPAFSWQDPSLSRSSATGQDHKQQRTHPLKIPQKAAHPYVTSPQPDQGISEPFPPVSNPPFFHNIISGSSVSQPQTIPHVPAHMHLLCDVLPCPVQASHASAQPKPPQTSDESQAQVVYKKTSFYSNEEPTLECVSSSPPEAPGAVEEQWPSCHRKQERNKKEKAQKKEESEKKTSASARKQRKSSRSFVEGEHSDGHHSTNSSSHQRLPKKVIPRTEPHSQQGAQQFPGESCAGDCIPPPSPVHSALGQVVSEILFPTVDSSTAQKTPVFLASPPDTMPAPSQSRVPPHTAQDSVEVISQLLQEAEDSDGKEFDDDPLLQVLRKQRTWVKKQISEVDSILNEFLDEQQVT